MSRHTKEWTAEDVALLREHYSKPHGLEFLIVSLGRGRSSIWMKAQRLNVPHYMYLLRGAKGAKGNKGEGGEITVDRLKECTITNAVTGCWEWAAGRHTAGYGKITLNHETVLVHRIMYAAAHPEDDIVDKAICHHCDNPPCCNPEHLYAGTDKDNMRDLFSRGTKSSLHLNVEKVVAVRRRLADGVRVVDVAREYGVPYAVIHAVKQRRTWRWVA